MFKSEEPLVVPSLLQSMQNRRYSSTFLKVCKDTEFNCIKSFFGEWGIACNPALYTEDAIMKRNKSRIPGNVPGNAFVGVIKDVIEFDRQTKAHQVICAANFRETHIQPKDLQQTSNCNMKNLLGFEVPPRRPTPLQPQQQQQLPFAPAPIQPQHIKLVPVDNPLANPFAIQRQPNIPPQNKVVAGLDLNRQPNNPRIRILN